MNKFIVLTAAFFLAFSCGAMSKKVNTDQPAQAKSAQAPGFSLKTPEGKTIKLSDYKGKAVLVNFWATWCPYCVKEMPDLIALYGKTGGKDFEIISVDIQENPETVKAFMAKNGIKHTVVIDPSGETAQAYRVVGIPTNVLIDKTGNVIFNQNELPSDLEKTLGDLLKK